MSKFVAKNISLMTTEDGEVLVCLTATERTRTAARATVNELKACNRELAVEVKPYSNSRSLRQNAMLWSLIEKIAQEECGYARKEETWETYCDLLEDANIAYEWLLAKDADALRGAYRAVREFGEREITTKDGNIISLHIYKCYIGSSRFTVEEMRNLIECALDRCAQLGIVDSEVETVRRTYGTV